MNNIVSVYIYVSKLGIGQGVLEQSIMMKRRIASLHLYNDELVWLAALKTCSLDALNVYSQQCLGDLCQVG